MRLKQVRISGFKSFCDPTVFELPGQLIGVVGPNGCGKSNIIDATRWVLGESRASELRGESMQDVIFNGSAERKPAARASVELVFDNQLGRVGGAWSTFAEISVRRILTRDGQSIYQINNQTVRRRDVHDIFLGTGLGPRAYAIIGQGTINRIIEARPEDLRIFLEEAAGVSRYRERRRETESRLSSTRLNLERVHDLLGELEERIQRLGQQAEVAQRWRDLEADRVARQQLAWWLRRDDARTDLQKVEVARSELRTALETLQTRLVHLESEETRQRVALDEAQRLADRRQAAWYELNGRVANAEAEIRYVAQTRDQLTARLGSLEVRLTQASAALEDARQQQENLEEGRELSLERLASLEEGQPERQLALDAAMQAQAAAMQAVSGSERQLADLRQSHSVATTRLRALDEAVLALEARQRRLREEQSRIDATDPSDPVASAARLEELRAIETGAEDALTALEDSLSDAARRLAPARQLVQDDAARVSSIQARIGVLSQLQARRQGGRKMVPWLQEHGVDPDGQRLWERLRIEPGWETAVEAVLRERVQSLVVTTPGKLSELLDAPVPARIALHVAERPTAEHQPPGQEEAPVPVGWRALRPLVHASEDTTARLLDDWLARVYTATTVQEAWSRRDQLPLGASIVVPAGHVLGRSDASLFALVSEDDGVLARQQELVSLEREERAQQLLSQGHVGEAARLQADVERLEGAVRQAREALAQAVQRSARHAVEHERALQSFRQRAEAVERVGGELADVAEQLAGRDEARAELREQLADLEEQRQLREAAAAGLVDEAARTRAVLDAAREASRVAELALQAARLSERAAADQLASLAQRVRADQASLELAAGEQAAVEAQRAALSDEQAREDLLEAQAERAEAESALAEVRSQVDTCGAGVRAIEEERRALEQQHEPLRTRETDLLLREQAARQQIEQMDQSLTEIQADEAVLAERVQALTTRPRPAALQAEVAQLAQRIAALGPVNLAALDELTGEVQRKDLLDAQSQDLHEAISTLEDAIRRMDQESRELLKETYETVNRHFGLLFPKLFGGGQAQLVLTGGDMLDAGVQVFAQPPGKKNSTIHLLSGGEKALTAIALVFAMFRLNPAPFCLLDEVDAPLDDANTSRYCEMVRSMSSETQFLFITHSKITMELAEQLIGVTMQERGVSRLVAVDLKAATALAEAA